MAHNKLRSERGAALIETAVTLPLILLVSIAIFEFGRAYQMTQVLTNAAREGARVAVITGHTDGQVTAAVKNYLSIGKIPNAANASVSINRNVPIAGTNTASTVTVTYPFSFIVLNPVARLVVSGSTMGASAFNMVATATMRNES
jgi:Flp pilus assembly protein TadG